MYESLNDTEKYLEYALILDTWKQLKEEQNRVNVSGWRVNDCNSYNMVEQSANGFFYRFMADGRCHEKR